MVSSIRFNRWSLNNLELIYLVDPCGCGSEMQVYGTIMCRCCFNDVSAGSVNFWFTKYSRLLHALLLSGGEGGQKDKMSNYQKGLNPVQHTK